MPEHAWKCPSCGASLSPGPFSRTVACTHCGTVVHVDEAVVASSRFREAYAAWSAPPPALAHVAFRVGEAFWTEVAPVARGEIADVVLVESVRWPRQRALCKTLRDARDLPMLEAEARALETLRESTVPGADRFATLVPQVVARGVAVGGRFRGEATTLLRHVPSFRRTLEDVRAAFPGGMDPHAGVWVWRRLLEVLSFLHRTGVVHGAVLPPHVLVEDGEHGVRLVGYGCAGAPGAPLAAVLTRHEALYAPETLRSARLARAGDLVAAARTVAWALGADATGRPPARVPAPLASLLEEAAAGRAGDDALALRERVGAAGAQAFGAPSFHPIVFPGDPPATV